MALNPKTGLTIIAVIAGAWLASFVSFYFIISLMSRVDGVAM